MKLPWKILLEVGSLILEVTRDEEPDLTAPVVVGDGLKFEWSYMDDRAPSHLEPSVLSFVLHGFNARVLPDVQLGDPVRFIFTTDETAARHIVFFRGRVTDADMDIVVPGRKLRRADLTITAADDNATNGDGRTIKPTFTEPGGSPLNNLVGFYEPFIHPSSWPSGMPGRYYFSTETREQNLLEFARRLTAGVLDGRRPHTVLSSSMYSGGRDVVTALPDVPGPVVVYPTTPGASPATYQPGTPLPVGYDVSARPAMFLAPLRVRLDGDEPAALALTLDDGQVAAVGAVPTAPSYSARTVLSADVVIAPGRARRDRSSVYNRVIISGDPGEEPDETKFETTVTAPDATVYGNVQRTVETLLARPAAGAVGNEMPTSAEISDAYIPDTDAVRAEWAFDDVLVLPDQAATPEQWLAAARLAQPANVRGQVGREVALVDIEDTPTDGPLLVGVQTRASLELVGGSPRITFGSQPGPLKAATTFGAHLVTAESLVGTPFNLPANAWDPSITAVTARYIARP